MPSETRSCGRHRGISGAKERVLKVGHRVQGSKDQRNRGPLLSSVPGAVSPNNSNAKHLEQQQSQNRRRPAGILKSHGYRTDGPSASHHSHHPLAARQGFSAGIQDHDHRSHPARPAALGRSPPCTRRRPPSSQRALPRCCRGQLQRSKAAGQT
jgi:hypothetical protein